MAACAAQRSEKCWGEDAAKGDSGKAYISPARVKQYLWEICCLAFSKIYPEFQTRARRDEKAFLSDQCKEIEENNRMGKIRDLFKKIRDTKGTFHAKLGSIKDRNGLDLTEAEDINKRWQENMEELYKKDLHNVDNHNGVFTDLETETSWNAKSSGPQEASLQTKLVEVMEFQVSYFKS